MILERVEIVGFRGINRLSLMLEQNNVLIGENAWGKSSLLDALTLLLSPESELYHFIREDFWFPPEIFRDVNIICILSSLSVNLSQAAIGCVDTARWRHVGLPVRMAFTVFSTAWRGERGRWQRDDAAQLP